MRVKVTPILDFFFKFTNFDWSARGTGRTMIKIFANGESHVKPLTPR